MTREQLVTNINDPEYVDRKAILDYDAEQRAEIERLKAQLATAKAGGNHGH